MSGRRSSGEIVRLAKYQVDRPTVDYPSADDPSGASGASGASARTTPSKIGRYTVLDLLGVGGMGVVCTAYDPKLDRKVALKLLRKKGKKGKGDSRNSTGQARLIREAQSLAKLTHPNIVTVHDVDKVDGQIYMAMEYVDGFSLDKWMVRAERQWREVVQVFVHAARGLAAAHAAGITHRDFKPANVLIGKDERVRVVDFGLAKSHDAEDRMESESGSRPPLDPATVLRERGSLMDVIGSTVDTKLTQVGRTVGTPAYMAPEQFLGLAVGPETDQFSFGVALYESLYGYLPFPDDDRDELIERVTAGRVTEPPKDTPVPSWVHRVVQRALHPRPEERFPNMDALIVALQADPAKRRRRMILAVGGVALVGMSGWGVAQGLASADDDICTGAAARMDEVWSEGRRAEVEAAFDATGLSYARDAWTRVDEELGRRTDAWIEHHVQVCRATNVRRDQSTHLMDVRMACLERRLGEMRALVEVFVSPDDKVILEAVKAAQSLEDSARCITELEGAGFEVKDPEQRRRIDDVDRLLARSKVMDVSGQPDRAVEVAATALRSARELAHRPTLARAAMRHAMLQAKGAHDPEQARDDLVEAIEFAAETNQPTLEVEGWAKLIILEGDTRGHPEAGLALRIPAEIALKRSQGPEADAQLDIAVGKVLHASGEYDAALEAQLRALEKHRAIYGRQHSNVATALGNVGAEYAKLGRTEEARRYLEEAASMLETLYGPRHPTLASVRINLGSMLHESKNPNAAHEEYLRAERVCRASLPPAHPRTLRAMLGLAQTELELDPERAEKRFEEVLAVLRSQKEPDLRIMMASYNSLGKLQRRQANEAEKIGDMQLAAEKRRRSQQNLTSALEMLEQHRSDGEAPIFLILAVHANLCNLEADRGSWQTAFDHCHTAWELQKDANAVERYGHAYLRALGRAAVHLGRHDDAVTFLRQGIERFPVRLSAPVRIDLADLLWTTPSTRKEATAIVEDGKRSMDSMPVEDAEALSRWSREH